eukprot:14487525-Alexandrium_andersonii.AAC.1
MSASLVGSEMCIRDRSAQAAPEEAPTRGRSRTRKGSRPPGGSEPPDGGRPYDDGSDSDEDDPDGGRDAAGAAGGPTARAAAPATTHRRENMPK